MSDNPASCIPSVFYFYNDKSQTDQEQRGSMIIFYFLLLINLSTCIRIILELN